MKNAATRAGFDKVSFRLEPLCAAAAELELLLKRKEIKVCSLPERSSCKCILTSRISLGKKFFLLTWVGVPA